MDPSIKFTTEEPRQDGSMPFLDTLVVTPHEDVTLTTSVYRKPNHTDLYLQWDSHYNLACKYSVTNTHTQDQNSVLPLQAAKKQNCNIFKRSFLQCIYPKWAIDKVLQQQEDRSTRNRRNQGRNNCSKIRKKCHIVAPYSWAYVRGTRTYVANVVPRYILKEETP